MKTEEKMNPPKSGQSKNYSQNSLLSYYKNYEFEMQFIVPWIQYDKIELENFKQEFQNK